MLDVDGISLQSKYWCWMRREAIAMTPPPILIRIPERRFRYIIEKIWPLTLPRLLVIQSRISKVSKNMLLLFHNLLLVLQLWNFITNSKWSSSGCSLLMFTQKNWVKWSINDEPTEHCGTDSGKKKWFTLDHILAKVPTFFQ